LPTKRSEKYGKGLNKILFRLFVPDRTPFSKPEARGRNFSVLRYVPVLKIDPYQRKAWNSAKEIERRF
jgi:hypothetical protein